MVDRDVVEQLQEFRSIVAALSRLPEAATAAEHGRAIAERLDHATRKVLLANDICARRYEGD